MSIATRLWLSTFVLITVIVSTTTLALMAISANRNFADSRREARTVVMDTTFVLADLVDAETGQRGYLLTGADRYLSPYVTSLTALSGHMNDLETVTQDHPDVAPKIGEIGQLAKAKIEELQETIQLRRTKGADAALQVVLTDRGKELMDRIRSLAAQVNAVELSTIDRLDVNVVRVNTEIVAALVAGGGAIIAVALIMNWRFLVSLRRPLKVLTDGIARVADGDLSREIEIIGRDELSGLAKSFNNMIADLRAARAQRFAAEKELAESNDTLRARSVELEERTRTTFLLGRLSNRLPACTSETEFVEVLQRFLPQIMTGIAGHLYTLPNSQNFLQSIGSWNEPRSSADDFVPQECWGVRRGQPHMVATLGEDVVCGHVKGAELLGYRCLPLVAQGETVGLLYLEEHSRRIQIRDADLEVMTETIASSLVGLRLRERLRTQSIRDALTGLFNRRYLEESMELEISRAERSKTPLSVVMMDVDHFKRFNDAFGHDAGDIVLKNVGELVRRLVRQGDVACRYGGEEIVLVLPATAPEEAQGLAERIRASLHQLDLSHRREALGMVTASFGVATFPAQGTTADAVIAAADEALYAAKDGGRDRVVMATS